MALPMISQTELVSTLAEETGYSKGDVKHFLAALEKLIHTALSDCQRVRVAGVQIEPKLKAATKKRKGRNPATGEEVTIQAKPASVKVLTKPMKTLKEKAPSVKKLQKAL